MTIRDRIAKRIHDLHNPGDWADHDFNGECACYVDADAVLDELGWDEAPTLDRPEDIYFTGARFVIDESHGVPVGTYRLIREDPE